ncbi:MAG: hypothetical protein GYB42_00910 [Alphaproteobacteria bacterium]|nr:hypothetical protein [Alphaproteobacteria bacterium]
MIVLQLLAAVFLFLSAALFFGPQLVIYGPQALPGLFRQRQARFVGGFLATVCVFAVTAPHFADAVIGGGVHMGQVAGGVSQLGQGVI